MTSAEARPPQRGKPSWSGAAAAADEWLGEVLLDCARLTCDPASVAAKAPVSGGAAAWRSCLQALEDNGLSPAGYLRLGGLSATPDTVRRQLRSSYEVSCVNHAFLKSELLTLHDGFDRAGIRAIPFKGVLFAETMYPEPPLRSSNDLDILIDPNEIQYAKEIMERRGYEVLNSENPDYVRKFLYHFHCVRTSPPTHVELHWRVAPPYFHFPLEFDAVWSRSKLARLGSDSIQSLCPEDLILILCANGAKENWRSMKVLCDIERVCASCTDVDWGCILDRARALRQTRLLGLGVTLAHRLLQCRIPPAVVTAVRRDPAIATLADKYVGRFLRGQSRRVSGRRTHLELMDIWCTDHGRAAYMRRVVVRRLPERFRLLLLPTEADRALQGRIFLRFMPVSLARVARLALKYRKQPVAGFRRLLDVLLG